MHVAKNQLQSDGPTQSPFSTHYFQRPTPKLSDYSSVTGAKQQHHPTPPEVEDDVALRAALKREAPALFEHFLRYNQQWNEDT